MTHRFREQARSHRGYRQGYSLQQFRELAQRSQIITAALQLRQPHQRLAPIPIPPPLPDLARTYQRNRQHQHAQQHPPPPGLRHIADRRRQAAQFLELINARDTRIHRRPPPSLPSSARSCSCASLAVLNIISGTWLRRSRVATSLSRPLRKSPSGSCTWRRSTSSSTCICPWVTSKRPFFGRFSANGS